jgi:hypothetical protein
MAKRFRRPTVKDGELKLFYGKYEKNDSDDVVTMWGDGAGHNGRDSNLLMDIFCNERPGTFLDPSTRLSLIEELENRGYDLSTLKFSIMKKNIE